MMTFGEAIKNMRNGEKVQRSGWNGKEMFIFFVSESGWHIQAFSQQVGTSIGHLKHCGFIAMKTADNKIVPWLSSQTDMLSIDWQIVL